MRVTNFTRRALAVRRDDRDMTAKGYAKVGPWVGILWDLSCGVRSNHRITDVRIHADGKQLWVLTEPTTT